jgi:hypothetical protein
MENLVDCASQIRDYEQQDYKTASEQVLQRRQKTKDDDVDAAICPAAL